MGAWGARLLWIARNVSRGVALEEECSRTRRQKKVLETRIVRGFDILAEGHELKEKEKEKKKGERISSALVRASRRLDERMKK